MADAERCLMCGIIIPEGRQVCPACGAPEREDDMLKKKDRLKVTLFGIKAVSKKLQEALDVLKQAENDYIQLHSFNGDKASVKQDPILSIMEGKVKVETALEHLQTIEKIMETEGAK
jgi:predicted nucleic acid-binding Zn ribbon protein